MTTTEEKKPFRFSGYTLDTSTGKLLGSGGQPVNLSSRAFAALQFLVENKGRVISKAELMTAVWPGLVVEENNLNQAISSIRKALGDGPPEHRFIQTIPGRGYRFIAALDMPPEETTGNPLVSPAKPGQQYARTMAGGRTSRWYLGRVATPAAVILSVMLIALNYVNNTDNVPDGVQLLADLPSQAPATFSAAAPVPAMKSSVAVLPFTAHSSSPKQDVFVIGLHDELINQLSKLNSLNVISRNSVLALADQNHSLRELAQLLDVQSLITGNVMFVGDNARVSLQLIDPVTGATRWASGYYTDSTNLHDLIAIQSDIALKVATALRAEINHQEQQALQALPTTSFPAYRYNLGAKSAYASLNYEQAWNLSKEAIALDPHYYDALHTFASVNTVLIGMPTLGMTSKEHIRLAMETAERMIALQPDSSKGHALKAAIHSTNREWEAVAKGIEVLRSLDTPLAEMPSLASVLMCLGDFDGAVSILEANLRVEPINLYSRGFLLAGHELAGNRLQARQEYELGEKLTPVWWGDNANIFLALGRNEPLEDIDELFGISGTLREALHNINSGKTDLARKAMLDYAQSDVKTPSESLFYGAIAAYTGEVNHSLVIMEHALEDVWLSFFWLWLPVFDEVRQLEGFKALLLESGIPDYWDQHGWPEMCQPEGDSFSCNWRAYP